MLTLLYRSAATWTGIGLASGLFYREFTKLNGVPGGTQLAVAHTHSLALGTTMLLVWLALAVTLELGSSKTFRWGVIVWNVGLTITVGGLIGKGMLQVLDNPVANSPAIAGISGLGHMTLTAAFIMVFIGLGKAVKARQLQSDVRP